jgi:hypothetical protein
MRSIFGEIAKEDPMHLRVSVLWESVVMSSMFGLFGFIAIDISTFPKFLISSF